MKIQTGTLHSGGLSTEIEIKALLERFGRSEVGAILTYEAIEDCIETPHDSARFRTVLGRYKRRMLDQYGVHFITLKNIGIKVLSAQERVELGIDGAGKAFKRIRVNAERLQQIPRDQLNQETTRRANTAQVLLAKVYNDFASNKLTIRAPGKADALPRLNVVGEK